MAILSRPRKVFGTMFAMSLKINKAQCMNETIAYLKINFCRIWAKFGSKKLRPKLIKG